ncbi:ATPase components of ABC transporters with duplicated ATPase domains [Clostridium acidisoli DSM 12555]|uniref:ATPase components of ABC transporters with duplicated ATPase domains n=1 Tax=Clostridium acidisoli DSM 12555 TaxID=1121291 RepID=A0A1W1XSS7_9CLOT|nr:ABC-F type ribosomal protection protein [Clostridium acidisoli]SMC26588.1 ATPase components of ABC transporters with duplicated ATPase domains [Clostridium acidisoli DSM 12555]
MIEISLSNVKKYYGANLILENVDFEVKTQERVGIVGINGCGKSTILKLIVQEEKVDGGNIAIRKGATIGYLKQIPDYEKSVKVKDVLNMAFEEINSIEEELRALEGKLNCLDEDELKKRLNKYSKLQEKFELLGGYNKVENFNKICMGLKFEDSFLEKTFEKTSGGEKTTVMLGKILLENPDILLLDEPTNHLDVYALDWLESYLENYKGTVIIVSHDRYFLDSVANKIIEIDKMASKTYLGNYSKYVKERDENLALQLQGYNENQKKIQSMEESIKRLRDWAKRGDNEKFIKRAASMEKRLEKMDKVDRPELEKKNMKLNIKVDGRSGEETIIAKDATKNFEDKVLFKNGDFLIKYGERVALIGANGAGKSTVIKILLEEEKLDSGEIKLGANAKVAYLPQNISFKDESITVLQCLREDINILEGKAREYLTKFMFFGESVFKKVSNLSGGEKTRLKLSKLLYEEVNLLILDEPTNHLDIQSIETLELALTNFLGTVFFISHDRYFINKIGDRIIALENKTFKTYLGNYDYYKLKKEEYEKNQNKKSADKKSLKKRQEVKRDYKDNKNENRKKDLENEISNLEKKIKYIDDQMNKFSLDYNKLDSLYKDKSNIQSNIDRLMEKWIEI